MRAWANAHVRALAQALGHLLRRPGESAFNILTLATALALPAFGYLAVENIRVLAGGMEAAPQMSIFLSASASPAERVRVEQQLGHLEAVRRFRWVGRDEALRDLQRASGSVDLLAGLTGNPLPDAYVVTLNTGDKQALTGVRDSLARLGGVAAVELDDTWVERVAALVSAGERLTLVAGLLLVAAAFASIVNTIRLQVFTRREEIEVALLFGATSAYLRRPFLYFGALEAGLGALVAWGVVALALSQATERLGGVFGAFSLAGALRGPGLWDGLVLVGTALALGWSAAALSVWQRVRVR